MAAMILAFARRILGLMAALSDDLELVRREAEYSIALGDALDHPFSLVHALYNAAMAIRWPVMAT